MDFDYSKTLWGRGTASLSMGSPTSIRLRECLRALRGLPDNASVLEVGCGAGQFIRALQQLRPGWQCHGCDISAPALTAARWYNDGVSYQLANDEKLPYNSEFFDAVVVFDVLEHVDNPAAFLAEIRRVLKPGGILYCFVPCEGDSLSFWHWLDMVGLKKNLTRRFAGHIQYFSRAAVNNLCSEAGYAVMSRRYSEHVLGQLLGIAVFMLMARSARALNQTQLNNEEFFQQLPVGPGGIGLLGRRMVNALVSLESFLLCRVPSPNLHIVVKKT